MYYFNYILELVYYVYIKSLNVFCFSDRSQQPYKEKNMGQIIMTCSLKIVSFIALCILNLGSVERKLKFIFSMHDINGNGLLTKEEIAGMLRYVSICCILQPSMVIL